MGQADVVLSLQKRLADRIPYGIHQQFGARVIRDLQCDAVRRGPGYGRRFDIGWCGGVALRISVGFRPEILFFCETICFGIVFRGFQAPWLSRFYTQNRRNQIEIEFVPLQKSGFRSFIDR